jgi:hypothetical protein
MSELNWFGCWATFFLLAGTWFTVRKDYKGWMLRAFGSLIWVYIGLRVHLFSLWLSELAFVGMALVGFMDWWIEEDAAERAEKFDKPTHHLCYHPEKATCPYCENFIGISEYLIKDGATLIQFDEVKKNGKNKNVKRQGKGKGVAEKRRNTRKKQVQSSTRRRSVKTDGKPRSRLNAKPRGTKKSGRNVRVQKDNRRTNAKSPRTSKV